MTRRERKLKGYRNRKLNFLFNKYIYGLNGFEFTLVKVMYL